jgi:hypothetical protein
MGHGGRRSIRIVAVVRRPAILSAVALLVALCPSTASAEGRAVLAFWPLPEEEARAEAADADGTPAVLDALAERPRLSLGLTGATQGTYRA